MALTFDAGSAAGESERILAVLREKGVRSTFFLSGGYIRKYPDLVRRIAADGHEVGNHTWSHPHLTTWEGTRRQETLPGLERGTLLRELGATAAAFEELTGGRMVPFWRAPFGEYNDEILGWAAREGWTHVAWTREEGGRSTLDSLDWVADRSSRLYLSSAHIMDRILAFGAGADGLNGGIVLMHLCTRGEDPGVERLGMLIDTLRERGYRLAAVSELYRETTLESEGVLSAALAAKMLPGRAP